MSLTSAILDYNDKLEPQYKLIADLLCQIIDSGIKNSNSKIWHGHPVWFIDENPIVGYSRLRDCMRLLFWSGQSFEEEGLIKEGKFKAAEVRYTDSAQIVQTDLIRWLDKAQTIQWDYKNLIKRKGVLLRI
ncbi:MAG: DUF1801 domain-containing protein [Saprospiraceae bacterium]|nr:DUF1801 domain-containing protein [Saprospiraceae bacterium]